MGISGGPYIVRDSSLILELDAADKNSYPGSGTTWSNLSSNVYTGSFVNTPTFDTTSGGNIVFNGTNQYINISNPANIQSQNFSISVWINPSAPSAAITDILDYDHATSPGQGWVLQSEDATTNRYYYLAYFDGSVYQPVGNFSAGKGVQITNGVWQNITYTKSGTSVIGYLNGVQSFSATATNATVSYIAGKTLRVGSYVNTISRLYNGKIANIQLYNRGLSASEILQNYNQQKSRFGL